MGGKTCSVLAASLEMAAEARSLPKEELCTLIMRQLQYYGLDELAKSLAENVGVPHSVMPSTKLAELAFAGLSSPFVGDDFSRNASAEFPDNGSDALSEEEDRGSEAPVEDAAPNSNSVPTVTFLDLEVPDTNDSPKSKLSYSTLYIATHKAACRTAAFSDDGALVATGSADMSLKVVDVSKMNNRSDSKDEDRPVIRTLYDHAGPINDVAFHPNGLVLASSSKDKCIKLYDLTKSNVRRSFRYLQDNSSVRSISFHPSGDYILAGTEHEYVRLYDVNTFQCYVGSNAADHHRSAVTQVRYAKQANMFVSCSKDGSIKIWDAANQRVITTIANAHGGEEVASACFSRTGKYILSAGKDAKAKLWDVSSGQVLVTYESAKRPSARMHAIFNFSEEYVLGADNESKVVVIWDARSGAILQKLTGHNAPVRFLAASPTDSSFISCSDDHRARYWNVDDSK